MDAATITARLVKARKDHATFVKVAGETVGTPLAGVFAMRVQTSADAVARLEIALMDASDR